MRGPSHLQANLSEDALSGQALADQGRCKAQLGHAAHKQLVGPVAVSKRSSAHSHWHVQCLISGIFTQS